LGCGKSGAYEKTLESPRETTDDQPSELVSMLISHISSHKSELRRAKKEGEKRNSELLYGSTVHNTFKNPETKTTKEHFKKLSFSFSYGVTAVNQGSHCSLRKYRGLARIPCQGVSLYILKCQFNSRGQYLADDERKKMGHFLIHIKRVFNKKWI
jgi:hypothetical protein